MDDKLISEKSAVLRERAAFLKGATYTKHTGCFSDGCTPCENASREFYPLPRVTRPRVVTNAIGKYRAVAGVVQHDCGDGRWITSSVYAPELIAQITDLLANPTEEVEDDA